MQGPDSVLEKAFASYVGSSHWCRQDKWEPSGFLQPSLRLRSPPSAHRSRTDAITLILRAPGCLHHSGHGQTQKPSGCTPSLPFVLMGKPRHREMKACASSLAVRELSR